MNASIKSLFAIECYATGAFPLVLFELAVTALILLVPISAFSEADTSWVRYYDGLASGYDEASSIAINAAGDVHVAGYSYGDGSGADYIVLKYSPSGDLLWERRYNGPGNGGDFASHIEVDDDGNVFVTGLSWGGSASGGGTETDYATLKYSPTGELRWARRYDGPGVSADQAIALAVDSFGSVYVTGESSPAAMYLPDIVTLKYDSVGTTLWERRYDGPIGLFDLARDIVVHNSEIAYVVGVSDGVLSYGECTVLTYDSSGTLIRERRFDAEGNEWTEPSAAVIDSGGAIYLTGYTDGISGDGFDYDYFTLKYDTNGALAWYELFGEPDHTTEIANDLVLDGSGNV